MLKSEDGMKEAMKMHTISTRQLYTVYERLPFLFLPSAYIVIVRFVPLVIDQYIITQVTNHNLGYRIWPRLAQHSITQVMIYNLGYVL